MINIIGSTWYTTLQGQTIGLVIIKQMYLNKIGYVERAYIGIGKGIDTIDTRTEEQNIAKHGSKFPLEQAKQLIGVQ